MASHGSDDGPVPRWLGRLCACMRLASAVSHAQNPRRLVSGHALCFPWPVVGHCLGRAARPITRPRSRLRAITCLGRGQEQRVARVASPANQAIGRSGRPQRTPCHPHISLRHAGHTGSATRPVRHHASSSLRHRPHACRASHASVAPSRSDDVDPVDPGRGLERLRAEAFAGVRRHLGSRDPHDQRGVEGRLRAHATPPLRAPDAAAPPQQLQEPPWSARQQIIESRIFPSDPGCAPRSRLPA
jgi:hypothetical protein